MNNLVGLKITDNEFARISRMVYRVAGIHLTESKKALVVSRLSRRVRELGLGSFGDYVDRLESNPVETLLLVNRITTNITRFYRESNQFEILRRQVLPQVVAAKKRKRERALRIWSAGCSSGEEVYTILFEILGAFGGSVPSYLDLKILGSDIATGALRKAYMGQYTAEELKGVSPEILDDYFNRDGEGRYCIKQSLRKYLVFRPINLVHDEFEFRHKIDIIFCRNVVIYFDRETRQAVYEKFYRVLNEPGFFFSGHSENLFKYGHAFKFMEKSIYEKVVA